jgi:3-dehydroquinate synthase
MTIPLDVALPAKVASSYPIRIGLGLLEDITAWIPKSISAVVIITDHHVRKLYAPLLERALERAGYKTLLLTFPAGEKSKNNRTKAKLEEQMLAQGCGRDSFIIALGGGVVGDLAGFIAATYMRGIPYIQIPTTLLAMVDSSVGGKTGINTPQGKNLIGAFWQPTAVISDIHCLKTLSKHQMINGLIEALKMFLTSDAASLHYLQEHVSAILDCDEAILSNIVLRAVTIKADIVASDERENHQRAILNCGHTIGHALEQLSNYQLLHGYAVALGILVEAKIAQLMGYLAEKQYVVIRSIFNRLDILTSELEQFDVNAVIQSTQSDKKKQAGLVRYVLLKDIGCVYEINNQFVHPVPDEIVRRAFLAISKE